MTHYSPWNFYFLTFWFLKLLFIFIFYIYWRIPVSLLLEKWHIGVSPYRVPVSVSAYPGNIDVKQCKMGLPACGDLEPDNNPLNLIFNLGTLRSRSTYTRL